MSDERAGHDPWQNGHIRTVIVRKLTDEQQVSVEMYHATTEESQRDLDAYMTLLRRHMLEHNKRVVLSYTKRVRDLDRQINARVNELEELAAEKRSLETGEPPCVEPGDGEEHPEPVQAIPLVNGRDLEE